MSIIWSGDLSKGLLHDDATRALAHYLTMIISMTKDHDTKGTHQPIIWSNGYIATEWLNSRL